MQNHTLFDHKPWMTITFDDSIWVLIAFFAVVGVIMPLAAFLYIHVPFWWGWWRDLP